MSESVLKAEGVFTWFRPGAARDESQPVAGTLEVAANGASTLALTGLLPDDDEPQGITFKPKPIDQQRWIVGVLKNSSYVFLRRLASDGTTYGAGLSHQRYRASDCIVFRHLEEFPDLDAVSKLMISLEALGDWASEAAVKVTQTTHGAASRASKPKTHTFELPTRTVRIRNTIAHTAATGSPVREAIIRQETYLESEPKAPQTLEAAREEFHLLEDLLLLLADVNVEMPWPTVWYDQAAGTYYFERRRTDPQKVEMLKSWAALPWLPKTFGKLLAKLESEQDILGPGLYLYLGIRRGTGLYLENKFSTAIFGLESLHRRVGTTQTQDKLAEKIARIIGDVKQAKDRNWLAGRLKNAGEPNLEERLFLTFSELDIGLDTKALRAFSKECADVRNQVAHFGGQRDGGYDVFVQRMYILNEAVRPLYHAVLLKRISFDANRIRAYFHKSPYAVQRRRMMKDAGLTFVASPEEVAATGDTPAPAAPAVLDPAA